LISFILQVDIHAFDLIPHRKDNRLSQTAVFLPKGILFCSYFSSNLPDPGFLSPLTVRPAETSQNVVKKDCLIPLFRVKMPCCIHRYSPASLWVSREFLTENGDFGVNSFRLIFQTQRIHIRLSSEADIDSFPAFWIEPGPRSSLPSRSKVNGLS
jgi:hypothetical protein